MGKKNYELRVSSIQTFWPGGAPKSKSLYDRNEKIAFTIHYDQEGRPLNGICGDFMTWEMVDDHTIKISGDGAMDRFEDGLIPWREHSIITVIIEEGVRTIGYWAFSSKYTRSCVEEVSLPKSLRYVPMNAFEGGPLENEIWPKYMG